MKNSKFLFDRVLIALIILVAVVGWMMHVVFASEGIPLVAALIGIELFLIAVGFMNVIIMVIIGFLFVKKEEETVTHAYYRLGYVVALLVGLVFVSPTFFGDSGGKSRVGAASGDIGAFNSALALYQVDLQAKTFPTTMAQLLTDNAPGWSGPYMATIGADPWGNAYTYTGGASNYTILSIHYSIYHKSETVRYILGEGILSTLP